MQKDDKWVVVVTIVLALAIVSYFALHKFWLNDGSIQASYNDSFSGNNQDIEPQGGNDGVAGKGNHSFWEELKGHDEGHVWLMGAADTSSRITSLLEEHWPIEAQPNIHNVSSEQPYLIDTWLEIAEAESLPENSWVLLQWHTWSAGELTTLESIVRQLLSKQPQLAITIVSDNAGENERDFAALSQAYDLSWVTADQLPTQLPELSLAHLPEKPLYDGIAVSEVKQVATTDLFYGGVELRPLSANDFMFDQYYALVDPTSQVDYEVAGDQVGIVYLTDSNGGVGMIELGGEPIGEIDCYTETLSQQVAWIPLNEEGTQTLSIKYAGESNANATASQVFVAGLIVLKE